MPKRYRQSKLGFKRVTRSKRRIASRGKARRRSKPLKKYGMKLMRSIAETRFISVSDNFPPTLSPAGYVHNNIYRCLLHDATSDAGLLKAITGGTGEGNRIGNRVELQGFHVRGCFRVPYDRRNVTIKIFLCDYNSTNGNPTNKAEFFYVQSGNAMLDKIQADRFHVKRLRTLRCKARDLWINPGEITTTGADATIWYDFYIPYRRHIVYQTQTGSAKVVGIREHLDLLMIPYDTTFTNSTLDVVVSANEQQITAYFKEVNI